MSNWIDEEAEKFQAAKNEKSEREKLIQVSGYWLTLRQQIESDVAKINGHAAFAELLKNRPITVTGTGNTCKITKLSQPTVTITVENHGVEILLKNFKIQYMGDAEPSSDEETFKVELREDGVILTSREKSLIVPEQAAEYILKPLIGSIRAMR